MNREKKGKKSILSLHFYIPSWSQMIARIPALAAQMSAIKKIGIFAIVVSNIKLIQRRTSNPPMILMIKPNAEMLH